VREKCPHQVTQCGCTFPNDHLSHPLPFLGGVHHVGCEAGHLSWRRRGRPPYQIVEITKPQRAEESRADGRAVSASIPLGTRRGQGLPAKPVPPTFVPHLPPVSAGPVQ